MEDLALPFASLSLGRLLGIDDEEAIELGRLARQVGPVFEQFATPGQHLAVEVAGEELVERLASIVTGPRANDNLLAQMAAGHGGGGEQERLGTAVLLFAAGVDSPASMVGLGTNLLLGHPDQASLLRRRPATDSELSWRAAPSESAYLPECLTSWFRSQAMCSAIPQDRDSARKAIRCAGALWSSC